MNKSNRFSFRALNVLMLASLLFFSQMFLASTAIGFGGLPQTRRMPGVRFSQLSKSQDASGPMQEEFSFLISDLKMDHQSEVNNLNLRIRYRYIAGIADSAYPDFILILKDIEKFLAAYPNEVDYWEIVNKKLTQMVLDKYPEIASLTIEIQVSPTRLDPYNRSSIVTRTRFGRARMKPQRTHNGHASFKSKSAQMICCARRI